MGGIEKLELAYNSIDIVQNGYITKSQMIEIIQYIHFIPEPSKIVKKIYNLLLKKGLNQNDVITQENYS